MLAATLDWGAIATALVAAIGVIGAGITVAFKMGQQDRGQSNLASTVDQMKNDNVIFRSEMRQSVGNLTTAVSVLTTKMNGIDHKSDVVIEKVTNGGTH